MATQSQNDLRRTYLILETSFWLFLLIPDWVLLVGFTVMTTPAQIPSDAPYAAEKARDYFDDNRLGRSHQPCDLSQGRRLAFKEAERVRGDNNDALFITTKLLSLARQSIAWHIVKTLEDPRYWTLKKVETNASYYALGLSCPDWRRAVFYDISTKGFRIYDYSAYGTLTYYHADENNQVCHLQICNQAPPGGIIFATTAYESTEICERSRPGVDAFWRLPDDVYGRTMSERARDLIISKATLPGMGQESNMVESWGRQVPKW